MSEPARPIPHPIQPLEREPNGDLRFKRNAIVRHLFDVGKLDLVELRRIDFREEDWEQLNQLLGFTLSRAPVSEQVRRAAESMYNDGVSELEARYRTVCELLKRTRAELAALRGASTPSGR